MILEPSFILQYFLGMSYLETMNIPVVYKQWYIERIKKELDKSSEAGSTQSKSIEANTPDMRQLQGRQRAQVPAKLRRFT